MTNLVLGPSPECNTAVAVNVAHHSVHFCMPEQSLVKLQRPKLCPLQRLTAKVQDNAAW